MFGPILFISSWTDLPGGYSGNALKRTSIQSFLSLVLPHISGLETAKIKYIYLDKHTVFNAASRKHEQQ